MRLFLDLDGVLTDFTKQLADLLGKPQRSVVSFNNDPKIWKKIDDAGEDFWINMPWMPNGRELWDAVKSYKPTILSSPTRHESSKKGKKKWIEDNISGTPVILDSNKARHANKGDILIDDRKKNIDLWNEAGGIGVLHKTNTDTLKKLEEAMKMEKEAALKPGRFEGPIDKMRHQETIKKSPKVEIPQKGKGSYDRKRDKQQLNEFTASLDDMADSLESKGLMKEAFELDSVSNSLDFFMKLAAKMSDTMYELLSDAANKGDDAAKETFLYKIKGKIYPSLHKKMKDRLKLTLDNIGSSDEETLSEFITYLREKNPSMWTSLLKYVDGIKEKEGEEGLDDKIKAVFLGGPSLYHHFIRFVKTPRKRDDPIAPKNSSPLLTGDLKSPQDLKEMNPKKLVESIKKYFPKPVQKKTILYYLAPVVGDLSKLNTGLSDEEIGKVKKLLVGREKRTPLSQPEIETLIPEAKKNEVQSIMRKMKDFFGYERKKRPSRSKGKMETQITPEEKVKEPVLSSTLDNIADRLESMGFLKEAYEIDVLANTVEAALDTSTLNGIKMLWDKFKGNLKEFYARVVELVQRNRLSYQGDSRWLTEQIEKMTGKPFFMSPRDFAVRSAEDDSEEN